MVFVSAPVLAARYDISLDPSQWIPHTTITGTYTKTSTPEGYLRVTMTSGHGDIRLRNASTFPFQEGAVLRYKWRVYAPAGYYCAVNDVLGSVYAIGKAMTTDHSWAGSIVIAANRWICTEVTMAPGRVVSYAYRYDNYAGSLIQQGSTTLTEAQYAALSTAFLYKRIVDNYYINTYYDIAEAFVESPEFNVSITSPADSSYLLPDQTLNLSASASDGQPPYSFEWLSDRDGILGSEQNLSIPGLSPGTHVLSVTCTDDADDVAQDNITVYVSDPPELQDIADHSITTGSSYTGPTPRLVGPQIPVTYSLVQSPTGMTIDSSTGIVSWPITDVSGSPYTITIRAQNPLGSDDESWVLTVIQTPGITSDIWSRIYAGTGAPTPNDYAAHVAIDSLQNVVMCGYTTGASGQGLNALLVKYNPMGEVLWSKIINAPPASGKAEFNDSFADVAVDSQDNVIVVGTISGTFTNYVSGSYHTAWLIQKYTPDGQTLLWQKIWQDNYPAWSPWQSANGVAIDADDNILVTGSSFGYWDSTRHQWVTFKFNKDGGVIWGPVRANFASDENLPDISYGVEVDSQGNAVVVGIKGVSGSGDYRNFDWYVRKYNGANGTMIWHDTYSGSANLADYTRAVAFDDQDNAIVVGYTNKGTNNGSGANYDWLMIKYSRDGSGSAGQRLWTKTYESATGRSESCNDIVTLDENDFFVAGSMSDGTVVHRRLAKISGIDGTLLAEQIWPSQYTQYYTGISRRDHLVAASALISNGTDNDGLTVLLTTEFAVRILTPESYSYFEQGSPVSFTSEIVGFAEPPYFFTWSSSLDGVLGTSSNFDISTLSLGQHVITLEMVYGLGETTHASIVANIIVPPQIEDAADQTTSDDHAWTFPAPAVNAGSQPITWSLVSAPAGMTINGNTGVISWSTPIVGLHSITIRATNPVGTDDKSFTLEVLAVPQVQDIPNDSVLDTDSYNGPVPVLSKGTAPVSWTLVNGPAGMTIDESTGQVQWPIPVPSFTAFTIVIRATNAVGFDEESWNLTVLSAPLLQPLSDQSANEGQSYTRTTPALVKGTSPIQWSLTSAPEGMTIHSTTGVITWPNPVEEGSPFVVTVRAENTWGTDSKNFNLNVIRPPVIDEIADAEVVDGSSYAAPLPVLLQGTPPITWSLPVHPSGMTVDSSTGQVRWPTVPALEGPHTVTLRASNAAGVDTETWQITVRITPNLAAIANQEIVEGEPYTGPSPVLIKGTQPITYDLVESPAGMTMDSQTGVVSWINTTSVGTPHRITIRAANAWGSDQVTWTLHVVRAPVLADIPDASITKGKVYFGPTPTLEDGTLPVTWTLVSGPTGMTISSTTGRVIWTGTPIAGPHTITIRASNLAGSDDESWILEVIAPPILGGMNNDSVMEYIAYTGAAPSVLEGTPPISFSLDAGPSGMQIEPETGVVSWAQAQPSLTPYTIRIRAANAVGASTSQFALTVLSPPSIQTISDAQVAEGTSYSSPPPQLVKGTSPVTWSLSEAPAGMQIHPATGVVSWSNPSADNSPYTLTTIATNEYGQDRKTWHLNVIRIPIIAAVDDIVVVETTAYSVQLHLTQGTLPVQWSLTQAPAGVTINSSGLVSWPVVPAVAGPHTVKARASNLAGAHEITWHITVRILPVIATIADASIVEGLTYTGPTPQLVKGTLPITWSLLEGPAGMVMDPDNGVVSWTQTTAVGNPHRITISAANAWGTTQRSFNLTVIRIPVIAEVDDSSAVQGGTYISKRPVLADGTAPVTWTLISGPAGLVIHDNGVVSWTPVSEVGSPHSITIRAANAAGSDDETWQLDVILPPRIAAIADASISELAPYHFTPSLTQGTPPVSWSFVQAPKGMIIDAATGAIAWNKPDAIHSPYSITVKAVNAVGSHTEAYWLAVQTAYTVAVSTDITEARSGTPIAIHGRTQWLDGTDAPRVPANIRLDVKGSSRTFAVQSDQNGRFEYLFTPLGTEAGVFSVFGEHPANRKTTPDDQFTIVGFQWGDKRITRTVAPLIDLSGEIAIYNLTDAVVDGLQADVLDLPANWSLQITAPQTLQPLEVGSLSYTFRAQDDLIAHAEPRIVLQHPLGGAVTTTLAIDVRALVASLKTHPSPLHASMVRGQQTLVKLSLFNEGSLVTEPLKVNLPQVSWLTLASEATIEPLNPGASAEIWLSLTPRTNLPLGPYTGSLVVAGTTVGATIPFEFKAVSDAVGDLLLRAEDEFTYYADGSPRVADAVVTVRDVFSKQVVASGTTDSAGELLVTNLPESYYEVTVRAEKHRDYTANIAIVPGRTKILSAFLPRQLVTYTWTVVPTEIEDHYEFVLETKFETNVPVPVVTIEPALFDLNKVGEGSMQVDYTITNHGLIAAEDAWFSFGDNSRYTFTPLVDEIGSVPAQSSIVVPVLVQRKGATPPPSRPTRPVSELLAKADMDSTMPPPPADDEPCREVTTAGVYYTLICGPDNRLKFVPVRFEYKRECPDKKPNKFFPNPPPPDDDKDDIWHKLADYLNDAGGGGGGGGGITTTLRNIYDKITNYFVSSDPDITVPPSSELGIPCDQCSFNLAKAIGGAVIDNVSSLSKIKCAANIGFNAGTAIRRCSYLGIFDLECLQAAYDSINEISEGCGGPEEGQWKESLKEIALAAAKYCLGVIPPSDGRFPPPPGGNTVDAALLRLLELNDRLVAYDQAIVAMFGDEVWLQAISQSKVNLSNWMIAFGAATTKAGEAGGRISDTEWENLTNPSIVPLPDPVTVEDIDRFCARWNRTLDYYDAEIYTVADVPEGWSTDFIAGDHLDARLNAAAEAAQDSIDEGFGDLFEAVADGAGHLKEALGDQAEGVCAKVKIQIRQEAVLTRAAFEASLEINNGAPTDMDNLNVFIQIKDADGNDANDLFVILPPELQGVTDVSGNGLIPAGATARATWIIVPTSDAAPFTDTIYYVGGRFSYTQEGLPISMPLYPDDILVRPDASLNVKYFHDKVVYSDDPFTDEIEAPEPFSLGLMMTNRGRGAAYRVCMTSAQPKIFDNEKGLLVDFAIVGSQVGAESVKPSLAVYLGDINPGATVVARWLMTSSLQGEFTDYNASYVHLDGLGDPRLSLIDSVEIHELIHAVRADVPTDDGISDFLVNDETDADSLPDILYLSDGTTAPVTAVVEAVVDEPIGATNLTTHITADFAAGYNYLRIPDPADGSLSLALVTRSDGKTIRLTDNAWITNRMVRKEGQDPYREKLLHLFDHFASAGPVTYTVTFTAVDNPLLIERFTLTADPVNAVEVTFNRPINPASFDWHDLVLTRDGGANLVTQPLAILRLTNRVYRINYLSTLTSTPGSYRLEIGLGNIQDTDGDSGIGSASVEWLRTLTPWDTNADRSVDLLDFASLAAGWRKINCRPPHWCGGADITRDGRCDIKDLTALTERWLQDIP